MRQDFQVIDGRFIVLRCKVKPNSLDVVTETCPFCSKQHYHGAGSDDWGKNVRVREDGIRILGHRTPHCVSRGVKITLADGTDVCNDDGWYLGIGDQQPEAKSKISNSGQKGAFRSLPADWHAASMTG